MDELLVERLHGLMGHTSWLTVDAFQYIPAILHPFILGGGRLSAPYLLAFVAIACWIYVMRDRKASASGGFLAYLFPPDVYLHSDAVRTYLLVSINGLIRLVVNLSVLIFSISQVAIWTGHGLAQAFGPGPQLEIGFWAVFCFGLAVFIMQDFAFWIAHYLFHKIPFLWEFHKVHHCPQVLTPITDSQFHPVETIGKGVSASIFLGPVLGVALYLFGGRPAEFTILGIAAFTLLFKLYGNFRHSHIWIEFPRWLSFVASSPAMHQIHHSKAEKHWDKNFAVMLSLWDYLFGTIYIPNGREKIDYGIAGIAGDEFDSIPKLYARPFQRAWQLVMPKAQGRTSPGTSTSCNGIDTTVTQAR